MAADPRLPDRKSANPRDDLRESADVATEIPDRYGVDGLVERGMSYRELAAAVRKVVRRPPASVDLRSAREIALPRW